MENSINTLQALIDHIYKLNITDDYKKRSSNCNN